MHFVRVCLCVGALWFSSAAAGEKAPVSNDEAPKWGFLGDDAQLLQTIQDADEAVLACVYEVEFQNIKGVAATVHLHVTVVRPFKGRLDIGNRIVIAFKIDNLPRDAADQQVFLRSLRDSDIGALRFCFLDRPKGAEKLYSAEWLSVPKFTAEMNDFMAQYRLNRGLTK